MSEFNLARVNVFYLYGFLLMLDIISRRALKLNVSFFYKDCLQVVFEYHKVTFSY